MSKQKFDGVIQAVHYNPDGQVDWVRAYLRRGPTFSDRIILDRYTLLEHLKSGKRYYAGQRMPMLASTFELHDPLQIMEKNGQSLIVAGNQDADHDHLTGVPII